MKKKKIYHFKFTDMKTIEFIDKEAEEIRKKYSDGFLKEKSAWNTLNRMSELKFQKQVLEYLIN